MKKNFCFLFLFCCSCCCIAQDRWEEISDSLKLVSRNKAEIILSHFDTIPEKKMLYSLLDKDYYIIISNKDTIYREFYISTDSLFVINEFREINTHLTSKKYKSKFKKRKELKRLKEEYEAIIKAFHSCDCKSDSIYKDEATYISGISSYFLLIDKNKKICQEHQFYSLTLPPPINPNLWIYLLRGLSTQIK